MNRIVSTYEISGLSLKIRDAETDTLYGILPIGNDDWQKDGDNSQAIFNLDRLTDGLTVKNKLRLGRFYKLQMAYIDGYGNVGYYSTVTIAKFTYYPTVSIVGFNRQMTNTDNTTYTGVYHNLSDPTEKCYQYRFVLMDEKSNVIESSGWKIHNSINDTLTYESNDSYQFLYSLEQNTKYHVQYSVKTNNNLQVNSPKYAVVATVSVDPELDATLHSSLDYDNGCINVWLESYKVWNKTNKTYDPPRLQGSFALTRASSKENYTVWTSIHYFLLSGQEPEGYIFQDFTIEQGETYQYAVQQYNLSGIYSNRIYSEIIDASFEDAFLFDGSQQLRIRFNPKVTNFKTVVQEAKKATMGSQFPFFFRNGYIEYKEFPVSGLISYLTDDNEYFMKRVNDLKMPVDWQDTTDITDDNLAYERRFKLGVLNWLNNGKVKLFRSPGEGNYIVRLMNISLSPNDSLSRMIHTFNCTATEVDEFNSQNLAKYGFLNAQPDIPMQLKFGTISLAEKLENYITLYQIAGNSDYVNAAIEKLAETDLLDGFTCQYIRISDVMPGTKFKLDDEYFEVGSTGQYEAHFDGGARGLYLIPEAIENTMNGIRRNMQGTIDYGILAITNNKFDTVSQIISSDKMYFHQGATPSNSWNWVNEINDVKHTITRIYKMHFSIQSDVIEVGSIKELIERYNLELYDQNEWSHVLDEDFDTLELVPERGHWELNPNYKKYRWQHNLETGDYEWVEDTTSEGQYVWVPAQSQSSGIDQSVNYPDKKWDSIEQQYKDVEKTAEVVDIDYIDYYGLSNGASAYVLENTLFRLPTGELYWFEWKDSKRIAATLRHWEITDKNNYTAYPSFVKIDDEVIDLAETEDLIVPTLVKVPKYINWGPAVTAEIWYQEQNVIYGLEKDESANLVPGQTNSMANLKAFADQAELLYTAKCLDYVRLSKKETDKNYYTAYMPNLHTVLKETDALGPNFYVWINNKFYGLDEDERYSFTDNEIWIPYSEMADSPYAEMFESDPWADKDANVLYTDMRTKQLTFYNALTTALEIQERQAVTA